MTKAEFICWIVVAWCFFWGVRSTLALTRFRKMKTPPTTGVIVFTCFIIAAQVTGLFLSLSAALWLRTIRQLHL